MTDMSSKGGVVTDSIASFSRLVILGGSKIYLPKVLNNTMAAEAAGTSGCEPFRCNINHKQSIRNGGHSACISL